MVTLAATVPPSTQTAASPPLTVTASGLDHPRRDNTPADNTPAGNTTALVENRWDGIIAWHHNHLSNGLLEGINSLVQAESPRQGLPQQKKMITIIYLTVAKLPLSTLTSPTPAYMTSR